MSPACAQPRAVHPPHSKRSWPTLYHSSRPLQCGQNSQKTAAQRGTAVRGSHPCLLPTPAAAPASAAASVSCGRVRRGHGAALDVAVDECSHLAPSLETFCVEHEWAG